MSDSVDHQELREALARVEAERNEVCDGLDRQTARLIAAQAQLAEAVGVMREAMCEPACVWFKRADALLARHAQAEQQEAQGAQAVDETPIPEYFQEACDKFDWTPEEALRFYAEGKHFDTDRGRTRILDTGAIASNALKHASLAYLEMKGDAELSELRAAAEYLKSKGLIE